MSRWILIVDDDKQFCRSLLDNLDIAIKKDKLDVKVECVLDSESAIRRYDETYEKGNKPSLVLADYVLDSKNGLDVAQAIKEIDNSAIVFLVTGFAERLKEENGDLWREVVKGVITKSGGIVASVLAIIYALSNVG